MSAVDLFPPLKIVEEQKRSLLPYMSFFSLTFRAMLNEKREKGLRLDSRLGFIFL